MWVGLDVICNRTGPRPAFNDLVEDVWRITRLVKPGFKTLLHGCCTMASFLILLYISTRLQGNLFNYWSVLRANAPSSSLSLLYLYSCVISPRPPWFRLLCQSRASTQGVKNRLTSHQKQSCSGGKVHKVNSVPLSYSCWLDQDIALPTFFSSASWFLRQP